VVDVKDTKKLTKKISEADVRVSNLKSHLHDAEEAAMNARYEYTQAIAPRLKKLLCVLEWKWPGKRGRREAKAEIDDNHEILKLVKPLEPKGYRNIDLEEMITFTLVPRYYTYGKTEVRISYASAKALGIVNPAKKKDWSRLRKQLEVAGLTDPDELAKLLEKKSE
jgi:hypothetical protein